MAKKRKLLVFVGVDITDAEKKLKRFNRDVGEAGKTLTKSFTAPLLAIGAAAGKAAYDLDDALDKIRAGSGATGKALEALQSDFRKVAGSAVQNFDTVATVVADVNTRLGATGKELQDFSTAILDASRLFNVDASSTLNATTRAMQNWNVAASGSVAFLDKLFVASQSTGIGLDRLAERVARDGATFRQLGFSVEEAMAMLGNFEKQGVEVEKTSMTLRMAVANLTRNGVTNIGAGFREAVKAIKEAGSAAAANVKAIEVFGSRAGPEMAAAIREGRFEIDELVKGLGDASGAIQQTVKDTDGFAENLARLKNKAGLALEPLGNSILSIADEAMAPLLKALDGASLGFSDTAVRAGMLTAALGPLTIGFAAAGKAAHSLLLLLASPAGLAGVGVGAVALAAITLKLETLKKEANVAEMAIQAVNDQFKTADSGTIQAQLDAVREKMKSLEEQALHTAKTTNAIKILNVQRELAKESPVGGGSRVSNNARVPQRRGSRSTLTDRVKPIVNSEISRIEEELKARKREESALAKLLGETKARESVGTSGGDGSTGSGGSGGKASKKSPEELLVASIRDQIKYMNADAEDFLPVLDEWLAKLKPLSDDWKTVKDLHMGISDDVEAKERKLLRAMEERHEKGLQYAEEARRQYWSEQAWMTQQGLMDGGEYLVKLKGDFENLGGLDVLAGLTEWSDDLREVFGKIQAQAGDLANDVLADLNKELDAGKIGAAEWREALTALIEEYGDLPLVVANLERIRDAQEENKRGLIDLNALTVEWAKDLQSGIADAIVEGRDFARTLSDIGREIAKIMVKLALFGNDGKGGMLGGLFGNLFGGFGGFGGMFEDGGVFAGGRVVPFAKGGVVSSPTLFPMAHGMGLMGEGSKPEGIFPLIRLNNGELAVQGQMAAPPESSPSVAVHVENNTGTPVRENNVTVNYDPSASQFVIGVVLENISQGGSLKKAVASVRK